MIPKIIHYCWFGRGEMNAMAKHCIESWKKFLPDYELYLWNEDNFDVNSTPWTKQAYETKKYAFVTDYVRLYALQKIGGIYMDTDVEVLKSLDKFLDAPAFSGFETKELIPTGIMASEKDGIWVNKMIEYYKDRPFLRACGTPDQITNVTVITNMMADYGFIPNNQFQTCNGIFHLYPFDYFCPKDQLTLKINLTENSHCIHHFNGSWFPTKTKLRKKLRSYLPLGFYLFLRKLFCKKPCKKE
ncbi:MAG: glycosyltransferase family 32 protein [Phocaeicola sp.]